MESLMADLRFGIRMMLRNPGFSAVAIITIAIGIGANSAIFSVVNTVLLRPLPYSDPNNLVVLWEKQNRIDQESPSLPDLVDWRSRAQSFEQIAAARRDNVNLIGSGEPERLLARQVTANFFATLGVSPQIGRTFTDEEERTKSPVVLISDALWKRRFGSDTTLVGKQINLYDQSFTVIGVLPRDFQFYTPADLFIPLSFMPERLKPAREEHGGVVAVARLSPRVSLEQASTEMDQIALDLEREYPKTNNSVRVKVNKIYTDMVGGIQSSLLLLLGAVAFVLLIACANVANLMLARAATRQREMAIRSALGASRGRVVRQLLTESVLLSLIGGVLGLLVAMWGADSLVGAVADTLPWIKRIDLDVNVLAFTFAASILTGIAFGLAPALQVSRTELSESLKEGARGVSGKQRVRSALVVSEMALSLVLLVGAGLLMKTFLRVSQIDPGFNPNNVLTMTFSLSPLRYSQSPQARAFYQQLEQKVAAVPGVQAASLTSFVPLGGAVVTAVLLEGQQFSNYGDQNLTVQSSVGVDYFQAMGISAIEGRTFNERDTEKTPLAAVIDENMARELFPDKDPVGQLVFLNEGEIRFEVVGVVRHIKHLSWDSDAQSGVRFQMYTDYNQIPDQFFVQGTNTMSLVVRTTVEPTSVVSAIRTRVAEIDRDQPVSNIRPMTDLIASAISQRRFSMILLGAFASTALVLAAVGIYGVMSYSVAQRSREIGIRIALGARGSDVVNLLVGQGLKLVLLGVGIGLVGAFVLTRLLSTLLFEVSATDVATFLVTPVILSGVALAASFVPARRAARVDPMDALRNE